jgi:hypothetical protein
MPHIGITFSKRRKYANAAFAFDISPPHRPFIARNPTFSVSQSFTSSSSASADMYESGYCSVS